MMQTNGLDRMPRFLRTIGSLWFAAVLLSLLLLAMACATVFESTHGTERALATFYHASWFQVFLALLGVNILATLLVRYPFSRRQAGFVVTHVSILLIFAGALVTAYFGIDGTMGIVEGQSESLVSVGGSTLSVMDEQGGQRVSLDLKRAIGNGFDERTLSASSLDIGNVRIHVDRYLPDTEVRKTVTNDAPHSRPAVQVTFAGDEERETVWVFAGQPQALGPVQAAYRVLESDEQVAELARPEKPEQPESIGSVRVSAGGALYAIPLERCMEKAEPVGNTGMTAKVLRYLPHATVAEGGGLVNASPRPMNPAIEVELTREDVTEKRLAFAKFPDFESMHSREQKIEAKVSFDFSARGPAHAPLEIVSSPSGALYARFALEGAEPVVREIRLGDSIEVPWSKGHLTVVQALDRARHGQEVVAADPVREKRVPAVHVSIHFEDGSADEQWVRRGYGTRVGAGRNPLQLMFGDRLIPLDFAVKLDRFRIGYYPGTQRPRSFESHVSITDAATGLAQSRVISMNHPTEYGGYTFYQSSYRMETGRTLSFLSVSRDPGQWIVFAGYIGTIAGMLFVLFLRVNDRKHAEAGSSGTPDSVEFPERNSKVIPLLTESPACQNSAGQVPLIRGAPRPVPLSPGLGRMRERKP